MSQQDSAFSVEDQKIMKQLFLVIGLFIVGTLTMAIVVNIVL
jgi:hypothetical protein